MINKKTIIKISLGLLLTFLFINLVILDVVVLRNNNKFEAINPSIISSLVAPSSPKTQDISNLSSSDLSGLNEKNCSTNCQKEINSALATLAAQLKKLSTTKPSTVVSKSNSPSGPAYFPLGGGVSTANGDWSYVGGAEGYFDKNNYPGAKKISLEAFLRVRDSGDANIRLYDATHGVVISNSEILGSGIISTLRSSGPLILLDGNNLLQVQLRSTTSSEVFMDNARLKIEY